MSGLEAVTRGDWEEKVAKSDKPVLVDFWAEWCGPCKMLSPTVEKLAGAYAGRMAVYKLDVSSEQELAARYGVRSIPSLLLFKGGEVAGQLVGLRREAEIKEMIDKHL